MGLLTSPPFRNPEPIPSDPRLLPEVAMLSDGLLIRVGPSPDDLSLLEDLSMGDALWDLGSNRLVDIETMACATLGAAQLAEMGLLPAPVQTPFGTGWFALASSRLITRDAAPSAILGTPRVFFRLWPETRITAEVQGRPVILRAS